MRRRAGAIWCTFKPSTDDAVGARERQVVVGSGLTAYWHRAFVRRRPFTITLI